MVTASTGLQPKTYRIESIDLLRGLVMIIMALDHTRDFFHVGGITGDPADLATTTPQLFMTRWITHFCAPVFVFLSGVSIWLQSKRKDKKSLSAFVIKRGLWLIFIELFIMSLAFSFDPGYHFIMLQTIWSIGISMVFLGLALWLPWQWVLGIGLLIVLGHNTLDYYEKGKQDLPTWYHFLHQPTFIPFSHQRFLAVLYPFLPWTGLMFVGYGCGRWLARLNEPVYRKRILITGISLIVAFVVLRYSNTYGNPRPWSHQKDDVFTGLSFLNTEKYPPSLLYLCMTIGPALIFLALFHSARGWLARIIKVYGEVPFFYYILHFYLIHLGAVLVFFARGHTLSQADTPNVPFRFVIPGEGFGLGGVYLTWFIIVALLYPLCKWYRNYKRTHHQWWLSYL